MADWQTFGVVVAVLLAVVLVVTHRSARAVVTADRPGGNHSTSELLTSVTVTQALFGVAVGTMAVVTGIPPAALGADTVTTGVIGVGVASGVALFGANTAGEWVATRAGVDVDAAIGLRDALAPATVGEGLLLWGIALPVVAVVEELLFRGVLVGAAAVGLGVSPWLLLGPATVLFALGHSAQGRTGVVVSGLLGLVLGVTFVLTGSLAAAVLAHYIANALEFLDGRWWV